TVTSTPDTQGPALLTMSFTPSAPDVSTGQVPVSISAHITDGDGAGHAGSGFTFGELTLTSPNGQATAFGNFDGTPAPGGSVTDGTFTGTVVIPQYAQPGTWTVTAVSLFDDNGNQQSYTN